jgi:hypothetical protein
VTGGRGDEGGQGGWFQPPNDPYGYHPDVRGWDTGPHDTAGYPQGQANPYQTGDFPAQRPYGAYPYGLDADDPYGPGQPGYDPFQPYPDFSPSPTRKRSKLPMLLGVLAIVIIVGAVVAIVLVNKNKEDNTASPPASSSERAAPPPNGKSSAQPPPSPGGPGGRDGWRTVDNLDDAGLTYQVPPDWKVSDVPRPSGLNVDFTGTAEYGIYDCDGQSYVRSFATSGDVQSKRGANLNLNKTVSDFAKSFATSYFKDTAKVDLGEPQETEIGGERAAKMTVPVTPRVSVPKCEAAKGEIAIVGVLLKAQGKPAGVAMLVVVSDVEGGPDDPKPLSSDVAQDILASVRPS